MLAKEKVVPRQSAVFALGVLALLIALAVPAAITVTDSPATNTYDLDVGEQAVVSQSLDVILEDTTNAPDATITLRDSETVQEDTQTLTEGETATYNVGNETMNVTLIGVEGTNANATFLVEYPRTYGWADGAKTFVDNLPFMLVVAFGLVLVGAVGAMKS